MQNYYRQPRKIYQQWSTAKTSLNLKNEKKKFKVKNDPEENYYENINQLEILSSKSKKQGDKYIDIKVLKIYSSQQNNSWGWKNSKKTILKNTITLSI